MADFPTLFALARDRSGWLGTRSGLDPDADGNLRLAAVPAVTPPVRLPGPYDVPPSGIAAGPCGETLVSETAEGRVLLLDALCGDRAVLGCPGHVSGAFDTPCGLLLAGEDLFVADAGNARVQVFALPALELRAVWRAGLRHPVGIAADSDGQVVVLDEAAAILRRFSRGGDDDHDFAARVSAQIAANGGLPDPRFMTVGELDWTLVSDAGLNAVILFDEAGNWLGRLAAPRADWQPRALLAVGSRLYVADAVSGSIFLMDAPSGQWLGRLGSYQGPVAAMAADGGGLLVKPGPGADFIHLVAGAGTISSGWIALGPLDAGEQTSWWRFGVDADTPAGTAVTIDSFCAPTAIPVPTQGNYVRAPGPDLLVDVGAPSSGLPADVERARFLWLRVTLHTQDSLATPVLHQIRAQTPGENMMSYLPNLFALADGSWSDAQGSATQRGFLGRLLALFQSELTGTEEIIDDLSRLLDAGFVPASDFDWLAAMLAFPMPPGLPAQQERELIRDAVALQGRRGTLASLRDQVELWTGVRPRLIERFRERHIWQMDGAGLGFGTALPALDPEGFLVPQATPRDSTGCDIEIGTASIGTANLQETTDFGTSLFAPDAHRFTVMLQAQELRSAEAVDAVRAVLDREKPAHTAYDLCIVEPLMRVGLQATIGVDSFVAGPVPPLRLDTSFSDIDAVTAAPDGAAGRVGARGSIGRDTILG